jgi:hypothetical protein
VVSEQLCAIVSGAPSPQMTDMTSPYATAAGFTGASGGTGATGGTGFTGATGTIALPSLVDAFPAIRQGAENMSSAVFFAVIRRLCVCYHDTSGPF